MSLKWGIPYCILGTKSETSPSYTTIKCPEQVVATPKIQRNVYDNVWAGKKFTCASKKPKKEKIDFPGSAWRAIVAQWRKVAVVVPRLFLNRRRSWFCHYLGLVCEI